MSINDKVHVKLDRAVLTQLQQRKEPGTTYSDVIQDLLNHYPIAEEQYDKELMRREKTIKREYKNHYAEILERIEALEKELKSSSLITGGGKI